MKPESKSKKEYLFRHLSGVKVCGRDTMEFYNRVPF